VTETLLSVTMRRLGENTLLFELVTRDGNVIATSLVLETEDRQSLHLSAIAQYANASVQAAVTIHTDPSRTEPAIEVAKLVLSNESKGAP
jgi:hypothetical protein